MATASINPQSSSPLYTKLPAEIRDIIFSYALSPYTPAAPPPPPKQNPLWPVTFRAPKPNPWAPIKTQYPTNSTYSRPGQRAKVHHPVNLLLVCKRTYLETAHLPVQLAAHNFYAPAKSGPSDVLDYAAYFARMSAQQQSLVKEVRVFSNILWLLDGGVEDMIAHPAMANIELLNLVIRWCDWRGWQHNQTLSLLGTQQPKEDEEAEEEEEEMAELTLTNSNSSVTSPEQQEQEFLDHDDASNTTTDSGPALTKYASVQDAISAATAQLAKLKCVRISIEAPYVKADELELQVLSLLAHPIHLNGKRAREADKTVAAHVQRTFEWEAPMCAWSDFCAHCGGGIGDDKACEERKKRRQKKLGPRVQGAVIRWK